MTFRASPGGWRRKPGRMGRKGGVVAPVLGPELLVNGDFGAGATGWTVTGPDATHIVTFAAGTMRYQSDTTSPQLSVTQTVPMLTIGVQYQITIVVSVSTSGSMKTDAIPGGTFTGVGTFVLTGVAVQNNLNLTRATASVDMTLDSVSVKRVF